ncbi:MAG: LysR substrate-binding domain-containing protein, partial [Nocardiaceae bacterium]|nr:LysR substrate-binding domain-containing protein [Nocardiaceae bacterium]
SRAAARLHLAQQALSRQIKGLEDEVGAPLFERTTRHVALTPAGRTFLAGARAALSAFDDAVYDAQREARELSGTLRLGYITGAALELTPYILATFRERHPSVTIEMHESPAADPSAGLRDGASDVAFIRMPQCHNGIHTQRLFDDPVVAMLSAQHRCARQTAVSVSDILADPITISATDDEIYRAFWRLDAARTTPPDEVPIASVTEEIQVVATGAGVSVTSAALTRYMAMPTLRCLPIVDWPASEVVVGWRTREDSELVQQFVQAARDACDAHPDVIQGIEAPPRMTTDEVTPESGWVRGDPAIR